MRIQHVGTVLIARLNVRHLASGAPVFARVTADWSGDDCTLRRGAILKARVETATPQARGTHGSKLALSFTKAQCGGTDITPFELALAAVAEAPTEWSNITNSAHFPTSFSNPHASGMVAGFGSAGIGDVSTTHLEFMGYRHTFPMRPNLRRGDVLDIKDLKLEIGTGPNRSSVLTSRNRDVSLDTYTQFLLVPASLAFLPSAAPLAATGPAGTSFRESPPVPAAPVPDNFETCAPPGCAVDLPITANELTGHTAASIAIGPLGYAPRSHKVIANFDDEESLAWLGQQELLLAFNPHTLIRRVGASAAHGTPVRLIRAVVFDPQSHGVLHAVDWEVADWRRYLWQLDGNRILVHVGMSFASMVPD